MTSKPTPGQQLRQALKLEKPLQVVGTINAYSALLAQHIGFRALYLSGAGVANASYGLPDLGMTNLTDVLEDVRRITGAVNLPLLVDVDTGWGTAFNIERTIREMIRAGAAGAHIEDQVQAKRCGHRPGKAIVPTKEMVDRIKAAVDAKTDPEFVVMAPLTLARKSSMQPLSALKYGAGADMIFLKVCANFRNTQHSPKVCKVLSLLTLLNLATLYLRKKN